MATGKGTCLSRRQNWNSYVNPLICPYYTRYLLYIICMRRSSAPEPSLPSPHCALTVVLSANHATMRGQRRPTEVACRRCNKKKGASQSAYTPSRSPPPTRSLLRHALRYAATQSDATPSWAQHGARSAPTSARNVPGPTPQATLKSQRGASKSRTRAMRGEQRVSSVVGRRRTCLRC